MDSIWESGEHVHVFTVVFLLLKGFWNLVTQGAELQNNLPNKVPSALASLTVFALSHGV